MSATVEVVGFALYLEAEIAGWSYERIEQKIILPSYKSDTGSVSRPIVMGREVSEYSPRSQWDFREANFALTPERQEFSEDNLKAMEDRGSWHSFSPEDYYKAPTQLRLGRTYRTDEEKELLADFEAKPIEEQREWLINSMAYDLKNLFFRVGEDKKLEQARKLRTPSVVVVEVTNEEMEKAITGTTPQSLIRRIQKVRVAKGLPEKIVTAK